LLAVIISTIISPDKCTSLGILKGWFFDPILLGALVALNVKTEKDFAKIVYGLAAGGVIVALWGILQWFGFSYLLPHQRVDPFGSFYSYLATGRAFGPFESPNYLGMYLAPIAALAAGYWLKSKLQFKIKNSYLISHNSYFLTFCLVTSLLALFLTKSLGAWLGLGVAALFLIWFYLFKSKILNLKSTYLIIFFALGFIILSVLILKYYPQRISDSFAARKEVWQVSWFLIKEHPILGIGLGTFPKIYNQTIPHIHFPPINWLQMHPHNIFLAFWLNLGLLGLISFIWLLYLFFKNCFKFLSPKSYLLNPTLTAAMLAILAHGLIDTTYWKNDLSAIFWIIMGLAYSQVQNPKPK
jgi:putative inorganic carbon (HCO3(-)) transporter